MPEIRPGQTIRQRTPELEVSNRLDPGRYVFRLVVVDTAGNRSEPAKLAVTVKPRETVVNPDVVIAQPVGGVLDPRRVVIGRNLNDLNNRRRR